MRIIRIYFQFSLQDWGFNSMPLRFSDLLALQKSEVRNPLDACYATKNEIEVFCAPWRRWRTRQAIAIKWWSFVLPSIYLCQRRRQSKSLVAFLDSWTRLPGSLLISFRFGWHLTWLCTFVPWWRCHLRLSCSSSTSSCLPPQKADAICMPPKSSSWISTMKERFNFKYNLSWGKFLLLNGVFFKNSWQLFCIIVRKEF